MPKWRPDTSLSLTYAVGPLRGRMALSTVILRRILPLRTTNNLHDKLVFLGDYFGPGGRSYELIDSLIELKRNNDVTFIRGRQEQMFIDALELKQESHYDRWIHEVGAPVAMEYISKINKSASSPFDIPRYRFKDFVPESHINFLNATKNYYNYKEYVFTYQKCESDQFQIIGSSPQGIEITPSTLSIDTQDKKTVMIIELNTMDACVAQTKKSRLVKFNWEKLD